jgi:hypothetical protein
MSWNVVIRIGPVYPGTRGRHKPKRPTAQARQPDQPQLESLDVGASIDIKIQHVKMGRLPFPINNTVAIPASV